MFNELFFKLLRPGYMPGKFSEEVPAFPFWLAERRYFLAPYAMTWLLLVYLGLLWPQEHIVEMVAWLGGDGL